MGLIGRTTYLAFCFGKKCSLTTMWGTDLRVSRVKAGGAARRRYQRLERGSGDLASGMGISKGIAPCKGEC